MPTPHQPTSAMRKLGADIRDARRRGKLTTTIFAERAFTTRKTLKRTEEASYAQPGLSAQRRER